MTGRDAIVLLLVAIIPLTFVAYEMAGLELSGWHTLSWYAHRDKRLRFLILAGVSLAALAIVVFLAFHFASNRIAR